MDMCRLSKEIIVKLSAEFAPEQVNLKVQTKPSDKGNALVVPYIDARDVIERLNEVVGGDWSDEYRSVNGGLECALTVCGVTRHDIGDTGNDNEPAKTAYSDALKRAAVKFGIGLYVYGMPKVWAKVKQKGSAYVIESKEEEARVRAQLVRPSSKPPSNGNGHGSGDATAFWTFVKANGISKQIATQALSDGGMNYDAVQRALENAYVLKAA